MYSRRCITAKYKSLNNEERIFGYTRVPSLSRKMDERFLWRSTWSIRAYSYFGKWWGEIVCSPTCRKWSPMYNFKVSYRLRPEAEGTGWRSCVTKPSDFKWPLYSRMCVVVEIDSTKQWASPYCSFHRTGVDVHVEVRNVDHLEKYICGTIRPWCFERQKKLSIHIHSNTAVQDLRRDRGVLARIINAAVNLYIISRLGDNPPVIVWKRMTCDHARTLERIICDTLKRLDAAHCKIVSSNQTPSYRILPISS